MLSDDYKCDWKTTPQSVGKITEEQKEGILSVVNKMRNKVYLHEYVDCACCGGKEFYTLAEKDRYGIPCFTCICTSCGLIQINPRMLKESYYKFYRDDYRKLEKKGDFDKDFKRQYDRINEILPLLEDRFNFEAKDAVVLEVGSYTGGLLKAFSDLGSDCVGIDVDNNVIKEIEGITVFNCDISRLHEFTDKKFDLILYIHVFEHILDPVSELKHINNFLKEDGLLFVTLPSLGSINKIDMKFPFTAYCQLAHVYGYYTHTLVSLFTKNGMIDYYIKETGRGITGIFMKEAFTCCRILNFLKQHEEARKEFQQCLDFRCKAQEIEHQ